MFIRLIATLLVRLGRPLPPAGGFCRPPRGPRTAPAIHPDLADDVGVHRRRVVQCLERPPSTAAGAALVPVDNGFLARVARLLDGLRPPVSGNPGDSAWRNPSLRDPARDRDATSFGIRSARLSPSGLAFAGAGVGAGAAQLVDLAKRRQERPGEGRADDVSGRRGNQPQAALVKRPEHAPRSRSC